MGFFSAVLGLVAYIYNFWVLVLMAPGFMINVQKFLPADVAVYFPYSIDNNPSRVDDLVEKVGLNVLLAGFFVIPHSIFARPSVKALFPLGEAYRSWYVLMSALSLHVLMYYWQPLTGPLDITFWDTTTSNPSLSNPLLIGYIVGYLWLVTSTFSLDHFELFGVKQGVGLDVYKKLGLNYEGTFAIRGHYKLVRHPIMTGFFIMFFCIPTMTFTHLFFSVACTAYCVGAVALFEEPDLVNLIGSPYEKYLNEVPAYCPFMPVIGAKKDSKFD